MSADHKKTVLIVDDDRFLLDMYSIKFNEQDFEVKLAGSAEEALNILNQGLVPDIVLIDVIMPGMDGFSLIAEMRKQQFDRKVALIILSNLGQKSDIEKGLASGADGYIVKASATPSEVVSKVTEILNNHA